MLKQKVRLVNQEGHHNKYYEMEDLGTGQFQVTYGRMGTAGQTNRYHISQWDRKYNEKVHRKGYTDVSTSNLSFEEIFAELDRKIEAMEIKEALNTAINY